MKNNIKLPFIMHGPDGLGTYLRARRGLTGLGSELNIGQNIAVVGSSGRLPAAKRGALIDTYDEVIRFNRAPVESYENLVGSKTTLRVVNNHVFANVELLSMGYNHQPQNFVKNLRNSKILYVGPDIEPYMNRHKNTHDSNEVFLYDYRTADFLKKEFNFISNKNFTLGLLFVCLLVHTGVKPSLFGFDIDEDERSRTHYWEDRPPVGKYHSISEEKALLKILIDSELVVCF